MNRLFGFLKRKRPYPDIHDWFELTYAQYLAIPRTILQSMPKDWQVSFVKLLQELDDHFEWRRSGCWVKFKDRKGRFMKDNLVDYERGRRILTQEQVKELNRDHKRRFGGEFGLGTLRPLEEKE